jgi:hypothetical protein
MCKIVHLAYIAKKTRVDHGNIHGMYASILKMNVMIWIGCSSHWTLHGWLLYGKAKHIMNKGEACDIEWEN